jgi:hypothetical protein
LPAVSIVAPGDVEWPLADSASISMWQDLSTIKIVKIHPFCNPPILFDLAVIDSGRLVARGSILTGSKLFSLKTDCVVLFRCNEGYRFGF